MSFTRGGDRLNENGVGSSEAGEDARRWRGILTSYFPWFVDDEECVAGPA